MEILKIRNDNELEQFKRRINLVDYARTLGYKIVPKESSRDFRMLQNDDGDKVAVTTSENGLGIYHSIQDERDYGTIIDFVKTRTGASFDQIRKELKLWISEPRSPAQAAQTQNRNSVPTPKS